MLVIRPATLRDIPDLAALGERAFVAAYGDAGPVADVTGHVRSHFSEAAVRAALGSDRDAYLLALEGDIPAGFIRLRTGPAPGGVPSENALEVAQLYVAPDMQRLGVGMNLMDAAVDRVRREGQDGIWLGVWEQAEWAIRFYQRYGFVRVGTVDFRLGNELQSDWLMWLPVGR